MRDVGVERRADDGGRWWHSVDDDPDRSHRRSDCPGLACPVVRSGTDRLAEVEGLTPFYLTQQEAHMLATGLARLADADARPVTAHSASGVVHRSPHADAVLRSLATALAEVTYR